MPADLALFEMQHVVDDHLREIAECFKAPKITLIVRNPQSGVDGSADAIFSDDDDLEAIVTSLRKRWQAK